MQLSGQVWRRLFWGAGVAYVVLLLAGSFWAAIEYREFYSRPALPSGLSESEVLQVWERQFGARSSEYRRFLGGFGLVLSIWLGIGAGAWGAAKRSWLQGLAALAAGSLLTLAVLSFLPWTWFPFDQYPAAAGWLMGWAPVVLLCWGLAGLLARRWAPPGITGPAH